MKAEEKERQMFFNLQSAMADADHWCRAAYWSLDEATALSFGRAPEIVKWDTVKRIRKYPRLRTITNGCET